MPKSKRAKTDFAGETGLKVGDSPDGTEKFTLFYGHTPVFSNFHRSKFTIDGNEFNTGEQYFHYMKAVTFKDSEMAENLLKSDSPAEQKRLGRQVKGYDEQEWKALGLTAMKDGCRAKFSQNTNLRKELFKTAGTTLVEASPRDRKWGIGLSVNNPDALNRKLWKGSNLLGKILTEIREELMKLPEYQDEIKKITGESNKTDERSKAEEGAAGTS